MASKRKRTESLTDLAVSLMDQGKYAEAEPLNREALGGCRRELGNAHRDTLDCIFNLANSLHEQGKYDEAEKLYREALDGFRRELGNAHPDTLTSINNLAVLLRKQAQIKLAEAERLTGKEQLDDTAVNALMFLAKEGASSL